MPKRKIIGKASILNVTFPLKRSSFILRHRRRGESDHFELFVEADDGAKSGRTIRIDYMPVNCVKGLKDLTKARVHFEDTSGPAEDDTLGSDPNELIESSGWFLGIDDDKIWAFESMVMDIQCIENTLFKFHIDCTVSSWGDSDIIKEASAEFIATGKEVAITEEERKPPTPEQIVTSAIKKYTSKALKDSSVPSNGIHACDGVDILIQTIWLEVQNTVNTDPELAKNLLNKLSELLKAEPRDYVDIHVIANCLYNEAVGTVPFGNNLWSFVVILNHLLRESLLHYTLSHDDEIYEMKKTLLKDIRNE